MTTSKKLFVVFGATGLQGGAILKYFNQQASYPYTIRAVTRDTSSTKAQALAAPNVEVKQADLNDDDSVKRVLDGASVVFLVTDVMAALRSGASELDQGKRVASLLAQSPTIEHFIWSGLPSISDASKGKYVNSINFDGKADVTKFIQNEKPDLWKKTTVLWLPPYFQLWQQVPLFGPNKKIDEQTGKETWIQETGVSSDLKWWAVDVAETGVVVNGILRARDALKTKTVTLLPRPESVHTITDHLKIWGRILGKDVKLEQVSKEKRRNDALALNLPDVSARALIDVELAFDEFGLKVLAPEGVVFPHEFLREDEKFLTWEEYVRREDWSAYLSG